jgi:hypothetical protein
LERLTEPFGHFRSRESWRGSGHSDIMTEPFGQ